MSIHSLVFFILFLFILWLFLLYVNAACLQNKTITNISVSPQTRTRFYFRGLYLPRIQYIWIQHLLFSFPCTRAFTFFKKINRLLTLQVQSQVQEKGRTDVFVVSFSSSITVRIYTDYRSLFFHCLTRLTIHSLFGCWFPAQ